MYPYAIGFDIGITSVGWATVALDEAERPCGIIGMGARIFEAAEKHDTGESLAAPRREARSARRRLRRRKHRKERIQNLLVSEGVITKKEMDDLFNGQLCDIYELRVRALDEAVTAREFARILLHISQRRGFRSNRKSGNSKEDGKLLNAVSANRKLMEEKGYRTVAELYLKDELYRAHKRNKGGNYVATVSRDMVADEVKQLFAAQRGFGAAFASEDFEAAYLEILLSQRSFDEGPGGDSPYGGSQIEKMWGHCTFETDKPRAAKASYSFEYFNLLERINHIRIAESGRSTALTGEQRNALIELAHKTESLDYAKLRKTLQLSPAQTFNMVRYDSELSAEEAEKKTKFCYLKAYHQMRKAFDKVAKGYFEQIGRAQRNAIGYALSVYKTEVKIREYLRKYDLSEKDIDIAVSIGSFTKSGHLSVEACDKLIPYLEQGMNYNDACAAAGYAFRGHEEGERTRLLHPAEEDLESITSPVVRRAVSQTVKVLNAIIRERGCSPTYINIELAREMAKDFTERQKIKKEYENNQARNERMMERIHTEYGIPSPSKQDLVKYRLWCEQDGRSVYSQKPIEIEHLFDPDYAEVDHIIPYSISFDDSYKNKVLVLAKENRDKGNRLPLQYLTGKRREDFIVWVNACIRDISKCQRLLKEEITKEDEKKFKERNLQDTRTVSRFLYNYINDNLEFAPSEKRKKRVTAVNGAVTAHMRKRWGITKIRENGDLHHAVDALVIACTTDGMVQKVSHYNDWRERRYVPGEDVSLAVDEETGEVIDRFHYPWRDFRRELEARLGSDPKRAIAGIPFYYDADIPVRPLFVSRMPRRKITGPAHKETVKSPAAIRDGLVVTKRALTDLKLDKDGEIANYYMPQSDRLLYEALKAQLLKFGGDGKKAFAEDFHKPKSDGTPGPVVKKVKLCEKNTLYVPLHKEENGKCAGIADNEKRVRIDVYYVPEQGYFFVPIYVADTLKAELPDIAYPSKRKMDDKDFLFSLYKNDLIYFESAKTITLYNTKKEGSTLPREKETQGGFFYYDGVDISNGRISFVAHDNSYWGRTVMRPLKTLEKYTVDVLGKYHKVKKEPRQPFQRKRG